MAVFSCNGTLHETLRGQLERIAKNHRGNVPLHGRLFKQWMHYVFPQECPFPHRSGAIGLHTPSEFGDDYLASPAQMKEHSKKKRDVKSAAKEKEEAAARQREPWMLQWAETEELLTDYKELRAPWIEVSMGPVSIIGAAALLAIAAALGLSRLSEQQAATTKNGGAAPLPAARAGVFV